jgi:hypothetical protein
MTAITSIEGNHNLEFVLEYEQKSLDVGTLVSGQNLLSGAVLGRQVVNSTATASAVTGTGVLTLTVGALGKNAMLDAYKATCITAGATAVYEFETATGQQLQQDLTVGGGATNIDDHFTITAVNSTNSAVGDTFTITVASATSQTITASAVTGTGNGTITAGVIAGLAKSGVYRAQCTVAAANAGIFAFYAPLTDEFIANVTVGGGSTSVGGHFAITITDGSADFVVGDYFTVTIVLPPAKYVAHDASAVDGSQNAVAILCYDTNATSADTKTTVMARDAEVHDGKLIWKSGITAAQKTAALQSLESKLIVVRA